MRSSVFVAVAAASMASSAMAQLERMRGEQRRESGCVLMDDTDDSDVQLPSLARSTNAKTQTFCERQRANGQVC